MKRSFISSRFGVGFCLGCLLTPLLAFSQGTIIVPPQAATMEGNSGGYGPFAGTTQTLADYEQVIAPSYFSSLPPEGVYLTGVSFRTDQASPSTPKTLDLTEVLVLVSTTTVPLSQLKFDAYFNHGNDLISAYYGSLSVVIPAGPPTSPSPFNIRIPFQNQFFYKPSNGSLALTVGTRGASFSDGVPIDYFNVPNLEMRLIRGHGSGGEMLAGGFALQFSYVPVPEPGATVWVLGAALFVLIRRSKT